MAEILSTWEVPIRTVLTQEEKNREFAGLSPAERNILEREYEAASLRVACKDRIKIASTWEDFVKITNTCDEMKDLFRTVKNGKRVKNAERTRTQLSRDMPNKNDFLRKKISNFRNEVADYMTSISRNSLAELTNIEYTTGQIYLSLRNPLQDDDYINRHADGTMSVNDRLAKIIEEIEKNPTSVFKPVDRLVKDDKTTVTKEVKISDNSDWGDMPKSDVSVVIPTLNAEDLDWLDESVTENANNSDTSSEVIEENKTEVELSNEDPEIYFGVSCEDDTDVDSSDIEPEINFYGSSDEDEELVLPVSVSFTLNTYRGIVRIGTGEILSFKDSKDAMADQIAKIALLTPELFSGVIERYPLVEYSERVRYSMSTYFYGLTRHHTERTNQLQIESGLIVLEHIMNGLLTEDHINTYVSVIDMERKAMESGKNRQQPKIQQSKNSKKWRK